MNAVPIAIEVFDQSDQLMFCNETFRRLFPKCRDLLLPGTFRWTLDAAKAAREKPVEARVQREVGTAVPGTQNSASEGAVKRTLRRHVDGRCFVYLETVAPEAFFIGMHIDVSGQYAEIASSEAHNGALSETVRRLEDIRTELVVEVERGRALEAGKFLGALF